MTHPDSNSIVLWGDYWYASIPGLNGKLLVLPSGNQLEQRTHSRLSRVQVSQAKAAISKEQQLKEQLREQMTSATNDSKRQASAGS